VPPKKPATGLSAAAQERLELKRIDERYRTFRTFIRSAVLALSIFFVEQAIVSLSGRSTNVLVTASLGLLADIKFVATITLAGAAIAWAIVERIVRHNMVKKLSKRVKELELRIDPRRSSSGLTPGGSTNPNDRMTYMADAIATVIVLIILTVIWLGPWQEAWTSWARQIIFECRAELFDMAADGEISFESSEYRTIRSALEMNIRFAHELNIWRLLALYRGFSKKQFEGKSELVSAMERISNPKTREKISGLIWQKNRATLVMVAAKSPISVALIFPSWVIIRACRRFTVRDCSIDQGSHEAVRSAARRVAEVAQLEAEAVCA